MLHTASLTKHYNGTVALHDLDLRVPAGRIYCLLGANGAGKTTTINLFLRFVAPTAGSLSVDRVDPASDPAAARAKLAYIPEQVSLYPLLSGRENLDYFARLAGITLERAERRAVRSRRLRRADREPARSALRRAVGIRHRQHRRHAEQRARHDLGFVVAILPLPAIVLCFDLPSADRASGRLALLAVQAGALRGLLWRRLVLHAALLGVPIAGLLLWGIAGGAPLAPLLLWCALAALYALFRLMLCAWTAARPRAPETQAAQLVALWLLLVLAVPAAINRLIGTLAPPPSQQSFRVGMRAAEIEADRRSVEPMRGFLHDHPELTVQGPEQYAAWMKTFFVSQRAVEERTGEVLAAHEAQRARADRYAHALQFLSPAAAMQLALRDAAGTGAAQQAAYVPAARSYQSELLQRVSPALFQAVRFTAPQLQAVPAFVAPLWTTAHGGTLLGAVFVYLTVACGALSFAAARAAHRLSPLASEFETGTVRSPA